MSAIQKATKRPVTIEFIRWDGTEDGANEIVEWIDGHGAVASYAPGSPADNVSPGIVFDTLEGVHIARAGHVIIRGVAGEFYSCEPAIFAETYDIEDPA